MSQDDYKDILTSVEMIKAECDNVEVKEFTGRGHFTLDEMGTKEFPELLQIIRN